MSLYLVYRPRPIATPILDASRARSGFPWSVMNRDDEGAEGTGVTSTVAPKDRKKKKKKKDKANDAGGLFAV
jgi:hypothetical protein